jgi:hypothetical protein
VRVFCPRAGKLAVVIAQHLGISLPEPLLQDCQVSDIAATLNTLSLRKAEPSAALLEIVSESESSALVLKLAAAGLKLWLKLWCSKSYHRGNLPRSVDERVLRNFRTYSSSIQRPRAFASSRSIELEHSLCIQLHMHDRQRELSRSVTRNGLRMHCSCCVYVRIRPGPQNGLDLVHLAAAAGLGPIRGWLSLASSYV